MIKIFVKLLAAAVVFVLISISVAIGYNNFPSSRPSHEELQFGFDRASAWVLANREKIINYHNPPIWEMLAKTVELVDSPELAEILESYRSANFTNYLRHPLRFQVYDKGAHQYSVETLLSYPYYNQLMIYAYYCDSDLGHL